MNAITMNLKTVDDDTFQEVKDFSEKHPDEVVIVDYWAERCGPCKALAPIIAKVAEYYTNHPVKFYSANADESGISMEENKIRSVPALVFMKAGRFDSSLIGFQSENAIKTKIEALI